MKKLLINIIVFLLITIVIGEVVVRLTHATSDIPQRTIDDHGIQKYFPNQDGYWKGGNHQWTINKLGWPGELPKSYDNLIMIIGDSFIENFMNPNECHQSAFLSSNIKDYNFMEVGRSGISMIEAMEISKQMDSLKPINSLIYVTDDDFYESITQVKLMKDITQLNIETNTIEYGEMKAPGLKKILYNWKLLYNLYNRFPLNINNEEAEPVLNTIETSNKPEYKTEVSKLLDFVKANYAVQNKTLVFHPNSSDYIIKMCQNIGFNTLLLDSSNDSTWTFDYDGHWTCYGHKRAAKQVEGYLRKNN